MAQKRNPLTPADDPTTGTYTARGKTPRQVERDIDHTRSEMSETLDALSDRLDPGHLKEQAMDQAKDFLAGPASDVGTSILDTVKEHPVPALAAALSIGWLVVKSGESDQDRRFEEEHYQRTGRYPAPGYAGYVRRNRRQYGYYDTGDYGGTYDSNKDDGSDRSLADKASDKASDVKNKAKDKASDLADQASDKLDDVGDQMHRYQRRASNWLEQQLHESPMLVGAVALAAGALVGLSVPETRKEDELMGRQSDRLTRQAKDLADEKLDQAKQVVQETADEAKSKAKQVAKTAKKEAKDVAATAKKEAEKAVPKASSTSKVKTTASGTSASSKTSGMEALEEKTQEVKAKKKAGSK